MVVNTIAATATRTGLTVRAGLDDGTYPTGVKVSKAEMDALPLARHDLHGEWNLCPVAHRFHYAGAGIMGRGTVYRGNVAESEGIRTA